MKKAALWMDRLFQKDAVFDRQSPLNRDQTFHPFALLKEAFYQKGWELRTQDAYKAARITPDAVVFMDIPGIPVDLLLGGWRGKTRKFAALMECEVVKPGNWVMKKHAGFEGIFTWDDSLVDGRKYFKLNFPVTIPLAPFTETGSRDKFCTLIAGNKKRTHPLELYSRRVEAIRWFEKNYPEDLEFYGAGWDRYVSACPVVNGVCNRVGFLAPLARGFAPSFPSYRGTVTAKNPVLRQYRFSICYENARDIPGYITEKIFDCFFAGCVPVYWGAPDVIRHIPEKCFIDRRDFSSYEELYAFMRNMTEERRREYVEAAQAFLAGPQAYPFSGEYFSETIAGVVTSEK